MLANPAQDPFTLYASHCMVTHLDQARAWRMWLAG